MREVTSFSIWWISSSTARCPLLRASRPVDRPTIATSRINSRIKAGRMETRRSRAASWLMALARAAVPSGQRLDGVFRRGEELEDFHQAGHVEDVLDQRLQSGHA